MNLSTTVASTTNVPFYSALGAYTLLDHFENSQGSSKTNYRNGYVYVYLLNTKTVQVIAQYSESRSCDASMSTSGTVIVKGLI